MNYKFGDFVLSIFIVVINSSYTNTTKIWDSSPDLPYPDELRNCENWIIYHGFVKTPDLNRTMALKRERIFDHEASVWAASYAYFISSFPPIVINSHGDVTPEGFCRKHISSLIEMPYLALNVALRSCDGWIYLYGYDISDIEKNWVMAYSRARSDDIFLHIWVAMYSEYIENMDRGAITPAEFCINIGSVVEPVPRVSQFAAQYTLLPCHVWIQYFNYTDNVEENITKASNQSVAFYPYLSKWLREYVMYLIKFNNERQNDGLGIIVLGLTPMTPVQFCNSIGMDQNYPVYYKI